MTMFMAETASTDTSSTSDSSIHQQREPPQPSLTETTSPKNATRSGEGSSRYENVACNHPITCPGEPFVAATFRLHRLSSPRVSLVSSPPLSPGTLSDSARRTSQVLQTARPNSCFAKAKSLYEHTPLRHFGPWLLLLLYALLGACLFFWLEATNEVQLLRREHNQLEKLRHDTLRRLARALRRFDDSRGNVTATARQGREVLLQFERELARTKLPEALAWDFWGALFYVQTVFTTIGYGNITPRTTAGQAMSIVYAIVGIPLVLALLNQTSKRMTRWLSKKWISYRQRVRQHVQRKKQQLGQREAEEGRVGDKANKKPSADAEEEMTESRTIPVWLALAIVGGYVCAIAAIFLVWESRWSYFTSFYFICISCLTIGLGDVVPDHPYMLIIMFVFVIFGLSFVSMLISVIQIKMEEWLYRMLMRMQKEYQKALEGVSDPVERERILAQVLAKEPWYMRELAPLCVSEKQTAKLDALAEQYERIYLPTNTRAVQTEKPESEGIESSDEEQQQMRTAQDQLQSHERPWTGTGPSSSQVAQSGLSRTDSFRSANSVSDATSLPMDPASFVPPMQPPRPVSREVQTDLPPTRVEVGVGTVEVRRTSCGTQIGVAKTNKRLDTEDLVERKESGTGTEPMAKSENREVQTEKRKKVRLVRADSIDEERTQQSAQVKAIHRSAQCTPPPRGHSTETQTEPQAIVDAVETLEGPSQMRERSESVQVVLGDELEDLLDMAYPERRPEKRDLVIQTDDSYLRIARKLDNLRTAKSEINIYCTGVGIPKRAQSGNPAGRRKSLRFLEPAVQQIRDSFRRHGKGEAKATEEKPSSSSPDRVQLDVEPGPSGEQARQESPSPSPRPVVAKRRKHVRLPPEEATGDDKGGEEK